MNEITILFRDDPEHQIFNQQIISFLEEKHRLLNQNGYVIRPVIVDTSNIDKYAKLGVQSLPALLTSNDNQENGVNNIIAFLSIKTEDPKNKQKNNILKNKFNNLIQEVSNISLDELKKEEKDGAAPKDLPNLDILTQDEIMNASKKFDYINKKQSVPTTKKRDGSKHREGTRSSFKEQNTKFNNMDKDEIHIMQQYLDSINSDDEDHYAPDYH